MSSVYATEPATAGRVILETTDGPLEIHLWSRECPHTTRLFLQLCLDGFYDDMIFHRIVSPLLIQTGALRHDAPSFPMTSPEAQAYREAVNAPTALDRRQYEVNSRIRFNHRGQVAMALGIDDNDNVEDLQPQFFITLEDAPYLDGKHVCFGTISGPTIFNALRIGRTEVDESTHQPLDLANATRIQKVKIIENPIHEDIVPQTKIPWRMAKQSAEDDEANQAKKKKKKKRTGKFDTNVLSFGDEFVEENNVESNVPKGMQSSHDVVESKLLSKEVDDQVKGAVLDSENNNNNITKKKDRGRKEKKKRSRSERSDSESDGDQEKEVNSKPEGPPRAANAEFSNGGVAYTKKETRESKQQDAQQSSSKKEKEQPKIVETKKATSEPKISAVEARRLKYSKGKKSKKEREEETLAKLDAFRSTVKQTVEEKKSSASSHKDQPRDDSLASRMARRAQQADGPDNNNESKHAAQAPTYHGQVLESDDEDNKNNDDGEQSGWLATSFKCRRHMDIDSQPDIGGDGRALDDYEVVDPANAKHKRHHHKHSSKHKHHDSRKHQHRGRK